VASDSSRPFGLEPAVRLVKEFADRPKKGGQYHSRQVPILVFVGPRGSGKSLLVAELARKIDESQNPYALIDFEKANFEMGANAPTHGLLAAIAFQLSRRYKGMEKLSFPRFIVGQLAINQTIDLTDRNRARTQIQQMLEDYRNVGKLRDFLLSMAGPWAGQRGVDRALVEQGVQLLLKGLTFGPWGRRALFGSGAAWYGHQGRRLSHDPIEALIDLNRNSRNTKDKLDRRAVEEVIWGAFLADLREGFERGLQSHRRSVNCLLLLDDADSPEAFTFLEELAEARHRLHRSQGQYDPLTVVAMSRGPLGLGIAGPAQLIPTPDAVRYEDYIQWRVPGDKKSESWHVTRLRDLNEIEVHEMASDCVLGAHNLDRVVKVVYQVTGGHPASARMVLDAITEPRNSHQPLREVLDWPTQADGHGTISDALLEPLLQGFTPNEIEDLTALAGARDLTQASQLKRSAMLTASPDALRALLGWEIWTLGSGERTMRPVLRLLLLRRLAARDSRHQANWNSLHGWLRDNCRASREEEGEFYHRLATGDLKAVVVRLADMLMAIETERDKKMWFKLLDSVSTAPARPLHSGPLNDHVQTLTNWTDPSDRPLAPLARLVAASWIATNAVGGEQEPGLHLARAADYDEIAPFCPKGLDDMLERAAEHRKLADKWGRE
jgi:hypothetical protein